ncbi:calmodulin-beta-like [Gigantopelta aegis]|uniref:calmodulin-beta-like n=1 Tax=Gigantopelta aegis TaxID=1735272 RepID=UPI001B88A6BE|nr:calmodulin-beta-like [Gigantopelta aegis]
MSMAHLSRVERESYTAAFLRVDTDGNGALDLPEFAGLCTGLELKLSRSQVEDIFSQIDKDNNGIITLDEFLAAMPHTVPEETREEANLRRSFNHVDNDGDGFLTASEIRLALKESGRDVTLQYAERMVGKLDKDGDGKVSLEEFVAYSKHKPT